MRSSSDIYPRTNRDPCRRLACQTLVASVLASCVAALFAREQSPTPQALPRESLPSYELAADDVVFLDELQERTFLFFWETTNPRTGLVLDRYPSPSPSSIAAVGFGLTGYSVGIERGWITREQGAERVLNTLKYFRDAPQSEAADAAGHRGFYYHFLELPSGQRWRNCELSSIDTALLMAGVLFCQEYYDRDTPQEKQIRELADQLYRQVQWNWMQPRPPLICMSWTPEQKYGNHDYGGYNEAMLLYVLALGSPTYAIDVAAWDQFTSTYIWDEYNGQLHVNFSPLYGHQYSHVWIDFRSIHDSYMQENGIDYFENSRRATYSQREYAISNPLQWTGYSDTIWGLTACDGPADGTFEFAGEKRRFSTYSARGASKEYTRDDGTIAPTAAGGSIPFAPEIAIPALRAMRNDYGDRLFSQYGFLDSFNPSFCYEQVEPKRGKIVPGDGWVNCDYLGIDQGPILLMAENYRSELIWRYMKKNCYLQRGLLRAGFTGGWLESPER